MLPTGGVIDRGPEDTVPSGPDAQQVLRARTELQRWRGVSGPSPGEPAETAAAGETLPSQGVQGDAWETLQGCLGACERDFQILRGGEFLRGVVNLPDPRGQALEQPQGRDWRRAHNNELTYGGGWITFGFSLLLALFLAIRGRIPLKEGFSGRKVERFNALERANHWVVAVSFLLIAITGLVLLYGQFFLKPWMGAASYSDLAEVSAYVHMAFMVPFTIGILLMIVLWLRQNLPSRVDWVWLKRGGGFFSDEAPSPPRGASMPARS